MKKFRTILTAAALCMIFVMAAGCSISQATNIELLSYPRTEYTQNTPVGDEQFTIHVTLSNGAQNTITCSINDPKGVRISNFSTENVGSFTATITYRSFSISFDYTVIGEESEYTGFAGGKGKQADPYLIANAEHFKNIVLKGDDEVYTYYELIADIDLSGLDVTEEAYLNKIALGHYKYPTESLYSFNGSLEGNGHKLMNFRATTDLGIFGTIYDGDFSNIVIDGFNTVGYRVGAFGTGPYSFDGTASASFTNVTINENCLLGFGGYIFQAKGVEEVRFTNCVMNGSVYGDGNNVGGFIGDTQAEATYFTNCTMNGTVIGLGQVGTFAGWVEDYSKFHLGEKENNAYGNSLGASANVKYILSASSRGNEGLNEVTETGTQIEGFKKEGNALAWTQVDGEGVYYRVVFGGALYHFVDKGVKQDGQTVYDLHFVGGYVTPLETSGRLTAPEYTGTIYTGFATSGGIEVGTWLSDTTGNLADTATESRASRRTTFTAAFGINLSAGQLTQATQVVALGDCVNGGSTTDGGNWLVVPSAKLSAGVSTIVAQTSTVTIYVFAYNADGIIIAGGAVPASVVNSFKTATGTQG